MALAVKAVGNSFLLGVFAHLRRINGVVVLVTAAGDLLNILVAQLALLATATLACSRHAAFGILLPGALEALSAVQAIARILGFEVFFVNGFSNLGKWKSE